MVLTRARRAKLEQQLQQIELRVWEINCWGDSYEKYMVKPGLITLAVHISEQLGEPFPYFFGR